jgi:esterase/lipase
MGKKIAEMWKKGVSGKIANEVMREHYFWKIFNKEIATKDNIINSLNKIKVPIQFIYGEKDYFLNMSLIKELSQKKKLSNKHEFVFLPEAGHYPMFEQQKQYIKISNAFMKKYHLGTKFSFLNQSKQGKILSKIKPHDQDTPSNVLNNGK